SAVLRGVGEADGVRQLGRDRDRDRQIALLGGRLAPFEMAREEKQELLDRPAPPDHRCRLAERRHQPAGRGQAADASRRRAFFAAEARLGGAAGAAACSDRLAFARGRFSPEATRLARLSLSASMRSITWARGAWGAATVTSLPSTFWLTRSRTRWRYSSSYCSGWNSSLDRPSMSCPARSSSPGLIFADCPRSI